MKIYKTCLDPTIKEFSAHSWYLTEELVPLALFF
uniref:Putative LOC101234889 [Hydra vulgaris] n=1 Tax=Lepeophtheirus salmonis TaxID=72036 RepID=A0A0K2T8C8_LEPSM